MQDINDEIEELIEFEETVGEVIPLNLTARLLAELLAEPAPMVGRTTGKAAPGRKRRTDVYVRDMSDDERRAYKAERQRDRRAKLKAKLVDHSVVVFNATSAREALADAALIILAKDLPGADQVRKYLAGVFRTQMGAILTLQARIKSGNMRPRLLKYTQPKAT